VIKPKKFSDQLKYLRACEDISQEQFGDQVEFSRSYVSQLEMSIEEPGPRFMRAVDRWMRERF
jgi:transcriptional regulator with XRE-family HTH domain